MAAACELVELVCGQTRIRSKKRRDFHLRYNTPHLAEVGLKIKRETPAQDQWVDEGLLPTYRPFIFSTTPHQSMMESLRQENKILYRILEQASIKFLCPLCFKGYSRTDRLYGHFRAANADEIHAGLDPRTGDFARFHSCFQQAMKISIPTKELSSLTEGGKCFGVAFVIQHYDKDPQSMAAKVDYQDLNAGTLPANCLPEPILKAFVSSIFIKSYHSSIRSRAVPSILCSHILGSPAATGYYASFYHKPASRSRISPNRRYTQHELSKEGMNKLSAQYCGGLCSDVLPHCDLCRLAYCENERSGEEGGMLNPDRLSRCDLHTTDLARSTKYSINGSG